MEIYSVTPLRPKAHVLFFKNLRMCLITTHNTCEVKSYQNTHIINKGVKLNFPVIKYKN